MCLEIDVHAHVSLITAVNQQRCKEANMIMVEEISGCLLRKGVEGWDLWGIVGAFIFLFVHSRFTCYKFL